MHTISQDGQDERHDDLGHTPHKHVMQFTCTFILFYNQWCTLLHFFQFVQKLGIHTKSVKIGKMINVMMIWVIQLISRWFNLLVNLILQPLIHIDALLKIFQQTKVSKIAPQCIVRKMSCVIIAIFLQHDFRQLT